MKRPTYKGFGILELSKLVMYDFHDFLIRRTYKDQAMFLFTDTDSLIYHTTKQHIFNDVKIDASLFHYFDYPKNH